MKSKPVNTAPFKDLYPYDAHFIKINGLKYHYVDQGAGETIVMVHGNPTWSFYFRHMIDGLSPSCRVLVPDHMGCGLSDKPGMDEYDFTLQSRVSDFSFFMDRVAPGQKVTLMVHDWGGMIGLAWAVKNPDRIKRLIITNTAGFFPPKGKQIPLRLWLIRNLGFFATPAVLLFNLFSFAALYMAPKTTLSTKVKKGLTAPYNCPKNRIATLKFVQDIPLKPEDAGYAMVKRVSDSLETLSSKPILVMWGKHDFVFDTAYFNEFKRRFPKGEFHLFEDAGHYLLEDKPDTILSLSKDFLKKHPI